MLARIASDTTDGPRLGASDLRSPNALDPMAAATVEERVSGIFGIISERVDSARRAAGIGLDSETGVLDLENADSSDNQRIAALISGFRVWPEGTSPETLILTLEARLFANDRLVSALTAQLVEHIVMGEDMRAQLAAARSRLDVDLSPVMAKFASRLVAAGVKGDHVRFLSRKRMGDVLAAIWGSTPEEVAGRLGETADPVLGVGGDPEAVDGSPTGSGDVDGKGGGKAGDDVDGAEGAVGRADSEGSADASDDSENGSADRVSAADSEGSEAGVDDSEMVVAEPAESAGRGDMVAPGIVVAETASDDGVDDASQVSTPPEVETGPLVADDGPADGGAGDRVSSSVTGGPGEAEVGGDADASGSHRTAVPVVETTWPSNPRGFTLMAGQVVVDADMPASPSSKETLVGTSLVLPGIEPIEIAPTGYVLIEWMPTNERDLEPRKFRLPSAGTMVAMALPGSEEAKAARLAEDRGDPVAARRFVELHAARHGWTLSEEEVRVWLMVLHEARVASTGGRSAQLLGAAGWYDGVRVPARPKVRVLRRADQSDLARVPSVAELRTAVGAGA